MNDVTAPSPVEDAAGTSARPAGAELSIVVPTYNERDNVEALVARVAEALSGVRFEIVFVDDDSPDGTADVVRAVARRDPRVRVVHRLDRRGLASATVEGMLSSAADWVAVMDADLQHDETLLPRMLDRLRRGDVDVVIGSRFVAGGGSEPRTRGRAALSRLGNRLARTVIGADLTDPMSGFFMIRHDAMLASLRGGVSGIGFKILVDLFAAAPSRLRYAELPYRFRRRRAGESKLDALVAWEYAMVLLDRLLGGLVPVRFLSFGIVGAVGVLVHFAVLSVLYRGLDVDFVAAQAAATVAAMTGNFFLNNLLTYRDVRLRGLALARGWLSFSLACSIGAVANVGVAAYLFRADAYWVASALAGVAVGAVWNYAVTSVYTWRRPRSAGTR